MRSRNRNFERAKYEGTRVVVPNILPALKGRTFNCYKQKGRLVRAERLEIIENLFEQ